MPIKLFLLRLEISSTVTLTLTILIDNIDVQQLFMLFASSNLNSAIVHKILTEHKSVWPKNINRARICYGIEILIEHILFMA